jgi:hypothetical protein
MTRARWFVVVLFAAVAVASYTMMPPAARVIPASADLRPSIRGAVHIHTRRSDGTGRVEDVAEAAARAGLQFLVFTDHGDATREPDTPRYLHGVLCIDAVEVSTQNGHVVAIGLPKAPYRFGGEGRDVVEDVQRLGGMAIAAHPVSAKPRLRWTDWNVPIDGLEWANADSEWRDEPIRTLSRTLLTYPFRRAETLASLLDRPDETLRHWDTLSAQRPIVAIAAADAHARIGWADEDSYDSRLSLHVPGYEQVFRTFSVALPSVTLTQDARADASAVVGAIRQGQLFSAIDALAGPAALSFSASQKNGRVEMGSETLLDGPATLDVRTNAPPGASIALFRDGAVVQTATGSQLTHVTTDPGTYRVEVQLPGAPGTPPVPWIVSNPIYLRSHTRASSAPSPTPLRQATQRYGDGPAAGWGVENSQSSRGALDVVSSVGGTQLSFRYALGGTESEGPYAALVMQVPEGLAGSERIVFTGRSNRPARFWVQVRESGGRSWHRSVFLDEDARTVSVRFDDMTPLEAATTGQAPLADLRSVLFVVDTVNTRPGTNGQLWLDDVKTGK